MGEIIQKDLRLAELTVTVLSRSDYDFDVYTDGRFVYLVAVCAKDFDANGYPVPNDMSAWSRNDLNMGIYYFVLEHAGNGQLKRPEAEEYTSGYDVRNTLTKAIPPGTPCPSAIPWAWTAR